MIGACFGNHEFGIFVCIGNSSIFKGCILTRNLQIIIGFHIVNRVAEC